MRLSGVILFAISVLVCISVIVYFSHKKSSPFQKVVQHITNPALAWPLSIDSFRAKQYAGSDLKIEETLAPGSNYTRYIASYQSEGLKIYGLLTVPSTEKPKDGYPVIIFNHGYIPPSEYRTTERYIAYVDTFARNGYIVFKSDYRGNGSSEGQPNGAYYSPAYTVDVLNALASVQKYKDANRSKIGMWGHSMGGNITLRSLEISLDIKAAVIWGGVVGSYNDLLHNWQRSVAYRPAPLDLQLRNNGRSQFVALYGDPSQNSAFWQAIDPTQHLDLISAPLQLHHGDADEEVPVAFATSLNTKMKAQNKSVELYTYPNADHNISSPSFETAISRSLAFFDLYLKK